MSTRTIDVHCHFIPRSLIEKIRSEGPRRSIHLHDEEGKEYVSFADRDATQPFPAGMLDLDERVAWMDDKGIDVQVLSAWMDFSAYVLDAEDGAWLARSLNDLTAEAISPRRDRFAAMAAVPLQAPGLAAEELRRAVRELDMVGVEIATSVVDRELDDPALDVFWAAAAELGVVVLVHPYASIGEGRLGRYFLSNAVGNPAEETVAAAHLVFGGVLERHRSLQICLTHGGGFLPYQVGRQDRAFVAKPDLSAQNISAPPSSFLRRFLYDSIVHGPEALRFLVERVGAERVVLGSDYPFPMGDPDPVGTIDAARLDDATRGAILCANAARAFGLEHDEPVASAPERTDAKTQAERVDHSFLVHGKGDHVGVAVVDIAAREDVLGVFVDTGEVITVTTRRPIPLGHKVALVNLPEGAEVLKYGIVIGCATASIEVGDHVHTHNLRSHRW